MSNTFVVTPDGEVSDGYHTFKELYDYRLVFNAALFNEWNKLGLYDVHKSRLHHDGLFPFGDPDWFIVVAELPTGQISNHYEVKKHWDLFDITERRQANVYDGHTPIQVLERMEEFLRISSGGIEELERLREHLFHSHKNEAAPGLNGEQAREYHENEHNGPGGLRMHEHAPGLRDLS